MKNKKNLFGISLLLFMGLAGLLVLSSCKKDDPPQEEEKKAPMITTSEASNITFNAAEVGGDVTDDGGAEVTARGICWALATNPSLSDNYIEEGTGTGTFSSVITGLASGTMYYVRAYAINSVDTVYGNEVSFRTAYKTGDVGPAGGIVFYDKGNNDDGWRFLEAAPSDLDTHVWGCAGSGIDGADGTGIGYGMQNTMDILAGCMDPNIAADACDNYMLNDYDDWFLPSKDELALMYDSLHSKGMGDFNNTPAYLSSTELNGNQVWSHNFEINFQNNAFPKTIPGRVRPIRAFE